MNIKTFLLIALAAIIIIGFLLAEVFTLRAKLDVTVTEAEYNQLVKEADAQHKADLEKIALQETVVTQQNQEIARLLAAAGQPTPEEIAKDREIAELRRKMAEQEAGGDLAGALATAKDTIKQWEVKFNLAEERHKGELFALNAAWEVKYAAQVKISDTWHAEYDREHALRLVGEDVTKGWKAKYQAKSKEVWIWRVATIAAAAVAVVK